MYQQDDALPKKQGNGYLEYQDRVIFSDRLSNGRQRVRVTTNHHITQGRLRTIHWVTSDKGIPLSCVQFTCIIKSMNTSTSYKGFVTSGAMAGHYLYAIQWRTLIIMIWKSSSLERVDAQMPRAMCIKNEWIIMEFFSFSYLIWLNPLNFSFNILT